MRRKGARYYGKIIFLWLERRLAKDTETFARRLHARLIFRENGCVEYQTSPWSNGYPRFSAWWEGKRLKFGAHQVFWTLFNWQVIPEDKVLDHKCENRKCVWHLQLITQSENNYYAHHGH